MSSVLVVGVLVNVEVKVIVTVGVSVVETRLGDGGREVEFKNIKSAMTKTELTMNHLIPKFPNFSGAKPPDFA